MTKLWINDKGGTGRRFKRRDKASGSRKRGAWLTTRVIAMWRTCCIMLFTRTRLSPSIHIRASSKPIPGAPVHFLFLTVQGHPFPPNHHLVTLQHGRRSRCTSDHAKKVQARSCRLTSSTNTKEGAIQRRYVFPFPVSLLNNGTLIVCRHSVSSPRRRGRGRLWDCLLSDPPTDWSKSCNKEDHAFRPLNVLPADATRTQTP
jgi:hypothetical protein